MIEIECWIETCNKIIKMSQAERAKSCQLRDNVDSTVKAVGYGPLEVWNKTTKALEKRIGEMLETKGKLQMYLHKVR